MTSQDQSLPWRSRAGARPRSRTTSPTASLRRAARSRRFEEVTFVLHIVKWTSRRRTWSRGAAAAPAARVLPGRGRGAAHLRARAAIRYLQAENEHEATGELDQATAGKLKDVHIA